MKNLISGVLFLLVISINTFSQSIMIEASLQDTILNPKSIKTYGEDIYILCNTYARYDTTYGIPHEGSLPYGSYIYVFDKYGNEKYHHFYPTAFTENGLQYMVYGMSEMANNFYVESGTIIIPFTIYNGLVMCDNHPNVYQNSKPGFIKADQESGNTLLYKLIIHDSSDCPNSFSEITSALFGNELMLLYNVTTANGDSVRISYRNRLNLELIRERSAHFDQYFSNCFFDEDKNIFLTQITDNIEHTSSIIKFDTAFAVTTVIENLNLLNLQYWEQIKTIRIAQEEYISIFTYYDYITNKRHSTLLRYTTDGTVVLNVFYENTMLTDLAIDYSGNVYGIQQFIGDRYWDAPGFRVLLFDETLGIVSWKEYDAGTESSISIDSDGNFYLIGSKFWNLTLVKDHISTLTSGSENKKSNLPSFVINPNPVTDKFTITLKEEAKQISVKIYSSNGVLQYSKEFENCSNTTIDVKGFKPGMYFVDVTDFERNTSTQKLVIN
jgi:hypothetical protein